MFSEKAQRAYTLRITLQLSDIIAPKCSDAIYMYPYTHTQIDVFIMNWQIIGGIEFLTHEGELYLLFSQVWSLTFGVCRSTLFPKGNFQSHQ